LSKWPGNEKDYQYGKQLYRDGVSEGSLLNSLFKNYGRPPKIKNRAKLQEAREWFNNFEWELIHQSEVYRCQKSIDNLFDDGETTPLPPELSGFTPKNLLIRTGSIIISIVVFSIMAIFAQLVREGVSISEFFEVLARVFL
jgi:hypothetical protein